MSVYEKYIDRETDLLNTFNKSQGSWTDYANYYSGVKHTWDGLDYPLTAGGKTKYKLTGQEAVDVANALGVPLGSPVTYSYQGNGVTLNGTKIGKLNNATSFQFNNDGTIDVTYVPSYQNHFNANAAGNNGLELFAAEHYSGGGMFWSNVPGFQGGAAEGKTIPYIFDFGSGTEYFTGNNAKRDFGIRHWETQGKTEGRIIPTSAIFSVDSNGKLSVNNDWVGEDYQPTFKSFADSVNGGAYKENYKQLISDIGKAFRNPSVHGIDDAGFLLDNFVGTKDAKGNPTGLIDAAYVANNIPNNERWNTEEDGAKAPLMDPEYSYFDADYYIGTSYGQDAANEYLKNATFSASDGRTIDNLDYSFKYGLDGTIDVNGNKIPVGYLSKYFTDASKSADFNPLDHRVTEEQETAAAKTYTETITDAEKEILRSYGLGLSGAAYDPATQTYQEFKDSLEFGIDPSGGTSDFFERDEAGNIIYDIDPETGAQTPRPKQVEIFQYETDEEGNPVYETDEEGNTLYATDEEGNQILDDEGNPIPIPKLVYEIEYKTDEDGNIVYEPERDANGNLIYINSLDEAGNPIPRLDRNGEPLRNEAGEIIYEQELKRTDQPQIASQTPVLNTDFLNNARTSAVGSSVFNIYGTKNIELQDQFQQLALDAFKTSYDKLKEVKKQESELNMLQGIPGYDEIFSANESIANSILGDSGIGGYLSLLGYDAQEVQENLESQLAGVTGISNNSVIFNWEKWFEEEFTERYKNLATIESEIQATIEELDPAKAVSNYEKFKEEVSNTTRLNEKGAVKKEWKNLMEKYGLDPVLSEEEALRQADPESWRELMRRYGLDENTTKEEAMAAFSETIPVLDKDGNPTGEVENKYNRLYLLEEDFKNSFIEDYLKPRFDQSKSMDEFISYMDSLDPNEQNILQTETGLTALTDVAAKYARQRLNDIYKAEDKVFEASFYMNPLAGDNSGWAEDDAKYKDYVLQAEKVAADWNEAKNNGNAVIEGTVSNAYPQGITWNDYAYYYGIDLSKEDQFARLHYEVVGQNYGFDPARDAITYKDIKDQANEDLVPLLEQETIALDGNVFSEFTTPEELADALLEGINPDENDPAWKELLELYGIDDYTTEIEAVRELIIETLQSSDAKAYREGIKYLNEKGRTPTQEELGVSYIQREEDKQDLEDPDIDILFKTFKDYGYGGTADDFYNDFMPDDVDRADLNFLTQALSGDLELKEISTDPFEALADISALFGDTGDNVFDSAIERDEQEEQEDFGNYFDLFGDDDSEDDDEYISDMDYSVFFK